MLGRQITKINIENMANSSAFYLTSSDGVVRISPTRVHSLLGIYEPYERCTYVPNARTGQYCKRHINGKNKARVPDLLAELVNVSIPSARAASLLEKLSTCAVCGITRWHQNKAMGIYEGWLQKLWRDYLRLNRLDPKLYGWEPSSFTKSDWKMALRLVQIRQRLESQSSSGYGSRGSAPGSNNAVTLSSTPHPVARSSNQVTSSGSLVDGLSNLATSFRNSVNDQSRSGSYTSSMRSSRSTFSVYRDPEPNPRRHLSSVAEATPSSRAESTGVSPQLTALRRAVSNALTPRDPNISAPRATRPAASSSSRVGSSSTSANAVDAPKPRGSTNGQQSNGSQDAVPGPSRGISSISPPSDGRVSDEAESEFEVVEAPYTSGEDSGTDEEGDGELDSASPRPQSSSDDVSEGDLVIANQAPEDQTEDQESSAEIREARNNGYQSNQPSSSSDEEQEDDFPANLLQMLVLTDDQNDHIPAATQSTSTLQPAATVSSLSFCLYPQVKPLRLFKILLDQLTRTVSPRHLKAGHIYAYACDSAPGHLKIGYTTKRPEDRFAKWEASCGHPVREVFRVPVPCATQRIEALVHTTLRSLRRKEDPPCGRCAARCGRSKGAHNEWFEVEEGPARAVVALWKSFSDQRPYDRFGRLVDFWSNKVVGNRERVCEGDSVRAWLDRMPRMVEELRREEFRSMLGPLERFALLSL